MNILIKLTCLIGLVIAPILGNGTSATPELKEVKCTMEMTTSCSEDMGKCDMSKCEKMTKEECAKMCDSLKCNPEQKQMCLSHYDAKGKFIASTYTEEEEKSCCAKDKGDSPEAIEKGTNHVSATITKTINGKKVTEKIEGTYNEVKAKMVDAMK
jgi:K(+)-stimulated pyrophosphate-energized sodium pump